MSSAAEALNRWLPMAAEELKRDGVASIDVDDFFQIDIPRDRWIEVAFEAFGALVEVSVDRSRRPMVGIGLEDDLSVREVGTNSAPRDVAALAAQLHEMSPPTLYLTRWSDVLCWGDEEYAIRDLGFLRDSPLISGDHVAFYREWRSGHDSEIGRAVFLTICERPDAEADVSLGGNGIV